jgi:rod shape-determining protein MreC
MLLVALVSQQSWAAGPRGVAKSALAPLEAGMTAFATEAGRLTSVMGDISSLRAENERLRAADAALRVQVVELNAAAKENATLRQALAFERSFGHSMVAAQVIGRGPDAFSRTMEIDQGSANGLRTGMVVVTGAGLLGRLGEVGPHASIVRTLADPQSRVNVYLSTSGLQGTVAGGSSTLALQIQPLMGVVTLPGDWALTSGIGGGYPRGLVVGEVANVTGATGELAWVNDPSSLDMVLVITDPVP